MPVPMLVTRPEADARRFAAAVAERVGPGEVVISPLMEIVPRSPAPDLTGIRGVILSSAHALDLPGLDWPPGLTAWCVGARTAAAARDCGLDARSADGALLDLLALIRAEASGPLLHLHGAHTTADIAGTLTADGIPTRAAVVYDQVARPLSAEATALLARPEPVVIPVFSPRSARLLAPTLENAAAIPLIAAISPAAASPLPVQSRGRVAVAKRPDGAAMLDLVSGFQNVMRA